MNDADGGNDVADWALLARYYSGACTDEEARRVEQWARATPEREREVALLREVWDRAAGRPLERRAAAALPRVAARIGLDPDQVPAPIVAHISPLEPEAVDQPTGERREIPEGRLARRRGSKRMTMAAQFGVRRRGPFAAAMRIAAVLVIGVASVLLWRSFADVGSKGDRALQPMHEYTTASARRAELRLADGTQVTLGVASRLRIPENFGEHTRDAYLEGTAYFVVSHDDTRPFLVHTATTTTEDIGTAFVVRAYAADSVTEVVVAEGAVALHPAAGGAGRGVALSRGQLGRVEQSGLVSVMDDVDLSTYLAWTQGRLVFHKTPLRQVGRELERWYDVEIELPDSALAQVPVTASFEDETADQALRDLARLLDLRYTRSGRTVRFTLVPAAR